MAQRVLVVEDDEGIRQLVSLIATRNGYIVDSATNGEDAIAALGRTRYCAVVLDLMMPAVDGYAVLLHVEENSISVPVIVMTATVQAVRDERLVASAVKAVFTKPFNIEALANAISSACAGNA